MTETLFLYEIRSNIADIVYLVVAKTDTGALKRLREEKNKDGTVINEREAIPEFIRGVCISENPMISLKLSQNCPIHEITPQEAKVS